MDDLYRENIVDHYNNPSHRGNLDPFDIKFADDNPLCGDHIQITMLLSDEGVITDAKFSGQGCAISQASADILLDEVIGKSVDEVKTLSKDDLIGMLGIELGAVRLKCALLSLKVLKAGVYGMSSADELDMLE